MALRAKDIIPLTMDVQGLFLLITVGAATSVEMVEAVTVVVASGVSRSWRSSLHGAGAALLLLAVLVAGFGSAVATFVPLDQLRVYIGVLLLLLGLQWLRKAILRASGFKALRDEAALFDKQMKNLVQGKTARKGTFDGTSFTVSFKGVFLEGVEVVLIVISLGTSSGRLGLAAVGATVAAVVVALIGLVLARPLSKVPENALKMGVGLMLITFGTFWMGEGVGIDWPAADAFILALLVFFAALTQGLVLWLTRQRVRVEAMVP